jgi:GcrA cell cycle regulator
MTQDLNPVYTTQEVWTKERTDALLRLRTNKNLTNADIQKLLNADFPHLPPLSRNAVIGKVQRLRSPTNTESVTRLAAKLRLPPPPHIPEPASIPFNEIKNGMCRWPVGDMADRIFRYCGQPTVDRTSFCAKHDRVVHPRKYKKPDGAQDPE